jgi:hypothetical protein
VKAARANMIREQWINVMQSRLLREELAKCHKTEGVNSYENCKEFVERYMDSLKTAKVILYSSLIQKTL